MKKRLLSAFLALSMIFSVIPIIPITPALAEDEVTVTAVSDAKQSMKLDGSNWVSTGTKQFDKIKIQFTNGKLTTFSVTNTLAKNTVSAMILVNSSLAPEAEADEGDDPDTKGVKFTYLRKNGWPSDLDNIDYTYPYFVSTSKESVDTNVELNLLDDTTFDILNSKSYTYDVDDENSETKTYTYEGFTSDDFKHAAEIIDATGDDTVALYAVGATSALSHDDTISIRIYLWNGATNNTANSDMFVMDMDIPIDATTEELVFPSPTTPTTKYITMPVNLKIPYQVDPADVPTTTTGSHMTISAADWTTGGSAASNIEVGKSYQVVYTIDATDDYNFADTITDKTGSTYSKVTTSTDTGLSQTGTVTKVEKKSDTQIEVTVTFDPIYVDSVTASGTGVGDTVTSSGTYTIPTDLDAVVTYSNGQEATFRYQGDGTFKGAVNGTDDTPGYLSLVDGTTTVSSTTITPTTGNTLAIVCAGTDSGVNVTSDGNDITADVADFSFKITISAADVKIAPPVIGGTPDSVGAAIGSTYVVDDSGEVTWEETDDSTATVSTFNYNTKYTASLDIVPADSSTHTMSSSAAVTFYDKADGTTKLGTADSWDGTTATINFPAIAAPTITARTNTANYDYYSGAAETFTVTQADKVFTTIQSVVLSNGTQTKTVTAANNTSNKYFSITSADSTTQTLTITKDFLDEFAAQIISAGDIDSISATTAQDWTVTVNFAGNGTAATASATHIKAVNTTPYLTITQPTSDTGTIAFSGTAPTAVKTNVYPLTKGSSYTLAYSSAPAHTRANDYRWTGGGSIPSDTDGTADDASYSFDVPAATTSDGARYTITASSAQPTRTITVTVSGGTASDSVSISPNTLASATTGSVTSGTITYTVYADTDYTITSSTSSTRMISSYTNTAGTATTPNSTSETESITKVTSGTASNPTMSVTFADRSSVTLDTPAKDWYSDTQSPTSFVYTNYDPGNYTLGSVKLGGTTLTAGTDYTIDTTAKTITINATTSTVISALGTSNANKSLVFDFGAGGTKTATITVHAARTVTSATLTAYTHGDKFNTAGHTLTLVINDNGSKTYTYDTATKAWSGASTSAPSGVVVKVNGGTGIDIGTFLTNYAAAPMYNTTDTSGATYSLANATPISFGIASTTPANLNGNSGVIVNKKDLTLTPANSNGNWDKTYDKTSALDGTLSISAVGSEVVAWDASHKDSISAGNFTVTGKYYKTVAHTTEASTYNGGTAWQVGLTATSTDDDAANYNLNVTSQTGVISRAPVDITVINAPNAALGDDFTTPKSETVTLSTDGSTNATTTSTLYDTVKLTYKYSYADTTSTGTKTNGVTIYKHDDTTYPATLDNSNYYITSMPSPVNGYVAAENVSSISVTAQPFLNYKYGVGTPATDKVVGDDYSLDLSTMKVKVGNDTYSYDTTNNQWVSGTKTLSTDQLKLTWTGTTDEAKHNDVLQPRLHNGKTITVTYTAGSGTAPTDATSQIVVDKAKLTVTPSIGAGDSLEKVYDGDADVDNATYLYAITAGKVKRRDNSNNEDTVSLTGSGITAAYKATTGFDDNDVVWDTTTNPSKPSVTYKPIAFTVASSGTLTGDHAGNYEIDAIPDEANGKITQKPITVSSITHITHAKQQVLTTQSGTVTSAKNTTSGNNRVTYSGIVSGDTVEIGFTYTYPDDIKSNTIDSTENHYDVTINTITFATPDLSNTGNNNGNYSIDTSVLPSTHTGTIDPVTVSGISLSIPKSGNSNPYTYVDDEKLDLNGARVTVTTSIGTDYYYYSDGTTGTSAGWYKVTGSGVTPAATDSPVTAPFTLRWNDTTLTGTASNQADAADDDTLTTTIMSNNNTDYRTGKIAAVHADGTHASSQLDIRINKKALSKIKATNTGTITKVYNNTKDLLTDDLSKVVLTAYYTPNGGSETAVGSSDISFSVTPQYASQYYSASDINIEFSKDDLSITSDKYKLGTLKASDIVRDSTLVGTISQRPITVTLIPTSHVAEKHTDDSSTAVTLTETTNYTVGLTTSPVNKGTSDSGETNALVSGDNVTLAVAGNFPNLTKGDDKHIVITTSNVTLANGTTDARNSYLVTVKPDPDDNYVLGNVLAQGRKLTVNSAHGTATVHNASTDSTMPGTAGVYELEYNEQYYIEVDPDDSNTAGGYRVDTISAVYSGSTDVGGTQAAVASSNKVRYTFTMPNADSTATVTFKQLPEWNPTPTAIDKNGNLTLKVKNDYNPTSVTISGLTLTSGTDYTISGKTITVNQAALKPLTIGATPTVTVGFADALATDDFTLTATPTVSNSAASVKSITKVSDPTQVSNTALEYGAGLDLNGMKFYTEVKQTGEKTTRTYYKYNNGWFKTIVTSDDPDGTPDTPANDDINTAVPDITAENITLAWTTTTNSPGTPAQNQLLKNSAHNGNTITVTWSDSDSGKYTYATDAWTVGKVALTMTATNDPATAKISKTYDTSAAVGNDASSSSNLDKIDIAVTGWVNNSLVNDSSNAIASPAANFVVSTTDATLDPNASSSDKTVKATWKISGTNLAEYTITLDGTTTNSFDATTEFTKNFTGEINKKDITIDSVTIPTLKVNEVSLEKGLTDATYAQAVTDAPNYIVINSGTTVYSADRSKLKFTFKGTYADKAVANNPHSFNKVDSTAYATAASGNYTYEITDTDSGVTSGNYNFIWPNTASGTVEDLAVSGISIEQHPAQTKTETKAYHGDALDLTDLIVNIHYADGTDSENIQYGTPDWNDAALVVKYNGVELLNNTTLRYDTHDGHNSKSFVVEKGGKTATIDQLIVDPRPITANVTLTGSLDKIYDGTDALPDTASISSTIVEDDATTLAILATDNITASSITADPTYSDIHAAKDVQIALSSEGHAITLSGENAQNYSITVSTGSASYTGNIGQRTINLETINIEPVYVNTSSEYLKKDHTASADMIDISDKDNIAELPSVAGRKYAVIGTGGEGEVATGDTVKIGYKAIYSASDVSATQAYPFELTLSDTDYSVSGKGVKGDYIINFPKNAATATVGQGEVKEKTLASIDANLADDDQFHFVHGDELDLTGLTLTLKYDDSANGADNEVYVYGDNGAAGKGWFKDAVPTDGTTAPVTLPNDVVLKWYKNGTAMAPVDPTYTMRYDNPDGYFTDGASTGSDKHGQIRITNESATDEIYTTVETTVSKRDVTLFVTGTVEKTYDSTNKTDGTTDTAATLTYTWENDAVNKKFILPADATALGDVGMNYLFNDSTVDADGLISTGGGALTAADLTYTGTESIADNYNITVDTTTGEVDGVTGVTATINKRTLKVSGLRGPVIMVGDSATGTVTLTNSNSAAAENKYTMPDNTNKAQGRDVIEIFYEYEFAANDVKKAGTNVAYTITTDPHVQIKDASDNPGKNYTLEFDEPAKGTVKNKGVTLVSVTSAPDNTVYTHGDTLDMTGSEITLAYSDGTTATFEYSATANKWVKTDDATATLPTNVVVAWAGTDPATLNFDGTDTFDDTAVQRYDEANALTHTKTINVYRQNDAGAVTQSAIATITVKQKEITKVLITGDDFDKRYNAKKDATVTNQVATVKDSNLVVKTPGTPAVYDDVQLKITKAEYPSPNANANSSGIELTTAGNFGYDMDYTIDFDNSGTNDNINYTLNLSGADAIETRHSASDTDPIKGVIKQLHVVFDYAPVTAVIKNEDATDSQPVTMTNKVINNSSAEAIHIDVDETNGKYDMPDEDKGVFRASYKATYSVDHIKGTDTTGLTVTDKTYSPDAIENNYDFEWPTLTPKLIVSADEIRAVTADYTAEFTHGDPLNLNGMKFTIVYTGSTPDAEFECTATGWTKDGLAVNLVDEGIVLEWVQAKDTDGTTPLEVSQGSPVLLHEHHATQSGADRVDQIRIKAPNSDGNYRTTTTGNITIHPKEIWVGVTGTDLDKTYDTEDTIETADRNNIEFTFYSADPTSVGDPTTIEYTGALIGDNDKFYIKEDWVAKYASANVKWDSDEYQPADVANKVVAQTISLDDLELDGDAVTGTSYTYAANYVLKNAANVFGEDDLSGKITPATAVIAVSLTQLPAIYTSTVDADRLDIELDDTNYTVGTLTKAGESDPEAVNVKVLYAYPSQADDDTNRHPNITLSSEPTTGDAVSTPTTNYIYTISPNPMVGLISDVAVETLEVTNSPKTAGYKHGNTVSLDGMAFKAATNDGTEYEYVFVDLKNPDGTDAGSGWAKKNADPDHVYTATDVEYIYVEDVDDGQNTYSGWAKKDSDPAHVYTVAELTGISPAGIQLAWVKDNGDDTFDPVTPTEDGRLIKNTHNGAKIQLTAGGKHAETDAFDIQPMPLYVKAAATDIEKPYDATSGVNGKDADGNTIDNLGKINYTLWTLDDSGDSFTLFNTTTIPDDIEVKKATAADFAKDNEGTLEKDANVAFDGAGAVTDKPIILEGFGLKGADFDNENYEFAGLTSSVTAASADPNAAPLTGKITKLEVEVKANSIGKITSETDDGALIAITDWETTPASPYAADRADIGEFTWKGVYDKDAKTVTPQTGTNVTVPDNETSRNYAFTFLTDAVNVSIPHKKAGEIEIVKEPKFVRDAKPEDPATTPAVKPEHGDKLDSEWEGFEYWVTYTEDGVEVSPSKHRLLADGTWKTDDGYTAPEDKTVFTWMNNNEAVTDFTDPDTYARADKNNQLQISLTGADGVDPKTTEALIADPKAVSITAGGTYSRPYDGTATVYGTPFTFTVPDSELSPEDLAAGTSVTATVSSVFVASSEDYKDKDVEGTEGNYSKPVKFGTPTIANTNYVPKTDSEGNYVINNGADFKSAITPKTLEITALSIKGRSSSDAKTFTVEKSNAYTTTGLAEGDDDITIGYSGTYTGSSGDVPVTISNLVIDGPDEQAARNYTPDFTGNATVNISTGDNGGTGGGGGGSVNTLTVHYKNEDGTAGDDVSAIYAPLGTEPVDLMGVFKQKIKDQTVLWTSSDENVATVDEDGHVTFVGVGTATITAQSKTTKSLKDTVQITITEAPPVPTADPNAPTPSPTPRPVYEKKDSLITKTMLNPYIVGYDDYVFGPELPISREELATIFARLIANDLYMDQDYDTSFPDVPNEWSKPYIGYLEQFDVVTGYEDGDFRPKNYITRAEMAVMMAKAEGYNLDGYVSSEDTGFPDMDEGYSTWAATKAIKILTDMGIMEGYTDGTFRPGKPITRAETVATVNRVLADMEVADYEVLPSDVTDAHWAYNDIVFAMNHRVLKDAAADPQRFVWSEQFDENMIINTEKVEGETVQVGEETPEGDAESTEETSDNPDAVAAESKEDTSEGDNAQTTE